MRQNSESKFDFDLESSRTFLSCAIANLALIQDWLYRDIFAMEERQQFLGTDHLKAWRDAMTTTFRELERIQADMDSAITAAFTKGD